jgi:type VI secretion system protein ImpA
MPSPAVLDFAKLLAPISGENPAGEDLRADSTPGSVYHTVRDARFANRAAERQLLADAEATAVPDWRPVLERGISVLAEKAKDLEIAAYVTEALVRLHGFAGLRDGFRLARELIARFWDTIYPLPDEDGLETRLAPLAGLNGRDGDGTLIRPILCVPLTQPEDGEAMACYHVQQATTLEQLKDEAARAKRLEDGAVPLSAIVQAVAQTPREFYATMVRDLGDCQDEFGRLCQVLDARCGSSTPPTSNIRGALAACRDALDQVARDKLPRGEEEVPTEATSSTHGNGKAPADPTRTAPPAATWSSPSACAGVVQTRSDAFRLLLEVADYFRRAEPQSVVSYGLEQVVRWGKMSLPDLLSELITEESPREKFFRQVGIRLTEAAAASAVPAETNEPRRNKWVTK